jgi:GNAT superfamily N-acetyltransferase
MDDLTELALARYCEAMFYDYEREWRTSGTVELDRPDVTAWKRPGWPVGYSRVSRATWTADEADAGIAAVLAFFRETPFHWHVGPSSGPRDLVDRLVVKGLVVLARPRLMTIALPLPSNWPSAADVRIVEVSDAREARVGLRLAHHDEADLDRDVAERLAYLETPGRRGGFLVAYLNNVPVANAGYRYSADGRCVYLTGAETAEPFRGRGIYKSIIAYRAARAAAWGCSLASIVANAETSARILARHGFADHGPMPRLAFPTAPSFTRSAVG